MKLKKLQLENFRNYATYGLEMPENKNLLLITGNNGKGKTNLLEAVYFLSIGRSFRTSSPEDLIYWNNDYLRIKGRLQTEEDEMELEVFSSRAPIRKKNLKRNEVSLKSSDYIGTFLNVLFHPEDLNMLYLSPSYRRQYLDVLLSQSDPFYLRALSDYKRVLKHRNALLCEINLKKRSGEDLEIWDNRLIEFGREVVLKRIRLINFFSSLVEKKYREIASGNDDVSIMYHSKLTEENIDRIYAEELFARRPYDIRDKKTSFGPHRDDFKLTINSREILKCASRGEIRTLLLSMKMAEIDFIRSKKGQNPILLLDDVFSELDRNRQNCLLEHLNDLQTIITATDLDSVTSEISSKSEIVII